MQHLADTKLVHFKTDIVLHIVIFPVQNSVDILVNIYFESLWQNKFELFGPFFGSGQFWALKLHLNLTATKCPFELFIVCTFMCLKTNLAFVIIKICTFLMSCKSCVPKSTKINFQNGQTLKWLTCPIFKKDQHVTT